MLESICTTLRNIGICIFSSGFFLIQFSNTTDGAWFSIVEGIVLIFVGSAGELKSQKLSDKINKKDKK